MIRPILLLSLTPFLAGCGLEELFSPGSSQARYEYQQAGLIQTPITPQPTQVAEIPVPAAVDVPEPVYVAPEPPAPYVPTPECLYDLYRIYSCVGGKIVMLP